MLGLSGGVDSSLAAFLAAEALGAENVLGIRMPYRTSSPESLEHADAGRRRDSASPSLTVEITPQIDAYFERFPDADDAPARQQDGARAHDDPLRPLGALDRAGARHQQQDRAAARLRHAARRHGVGRQSARRPLQDAGVGARRARSACRAPIVDKQPSADLWQGQTDERELGFAYARSTSCSTSWSTSATRPRRARRGRLRAGVRRARRRHGARSQFKRRLPVIAKVSQRTIDRDFRYARDWGR